MAVVVFSFHYLAELQEFGRPSKEYEESSDIAQQLD